MRRMLDEREREERAHRQAASSQEGPRGSKSSQLAPRHANQPKRAGEPHHRLRLREDVASNSSNPQGGAAAQARSVEPVDLRLTESSDEFPPQLTAENVKRHNQENHETRAVEEEEVEEHVVATTAAGHSTAHPPPKNLAERVKWLNSKAKRSLVFFRDRVKAMTWKQHLWVSFLVVLVTAGNAMQILMLNFWLQIFEEAGVSGNYTAFAVPGILFALFFVIVLAGYVAVKKPNMKFAGHRYGWQILIGVGFCDTFNSWLATYAASHTSEVLQALFTNLSPLYAVFMSKWILHDPRAYWNVWIVAVFILTIVGILIASVYGIVVSGDIGEGKIWIFIFFLSIPFRVLMNVWQSLYMIVYTRDPMFAEWLGRYFWRSSRHGGGGAGDRGEQGGKSVDGGDRYDAVNGMRSVPLQLDDGLAEDIILDEIDAGEDHVGSARMIIAPPPSACPSEQPLDDRERHSNANVSFGQHSSLTERRLEPFPATRNTSRIAGSDNEARPSVANTPQPAAASQEIVSIRYHQGEDMVVKLVMLAGETTAQICFTLALLPADALPWWGNSKTVDETWTGFAEGFVHVFTVRKNFLFGFLYTLGFVFTYVGCAYLNHYSVALCSIVTQLSSPLTALLLVLVPSWNVQGGGDSPWFMSVIAIVLLSLAAFIYVVWEEQTDAEKVEGERVLKMKKLRVRPLEPTPTVPLGNSTL